jgi:hypothetical protein
LLDQFVGVRALLERIDDHGNAGPALGGLSHQRVRVKVRYARLEKALGF